MYAAEKVMGAGKVSVSRLYGDAVAKTLGDGTRPHVDIRTGFSPLIGAKSIQSVNKVQTEG